MTDVIPIGSAPSEHGRNPSQAETLPESRRENTTGARQPAQSGGQDFLDDRRNSKRKSTGEILRLEGPASVHKSAFLAPDVLGFSRHGSGDVQAAAFGLKNRSRRAVRKFKYGVGTRHNG